MAENTKIEWCDHTWSPWWGCVEVSPECDNCYARELDHRFPILGQTHWGKDKPRRMFGAEHWRKPINWNKQAGWQGKRFRVFPSMCDPLEYRDDLLEPRADFLSLIQKTANLDWLVLSKRPQNFNRLVPEHPRSLWLGATVGCKQTLWRIDALRQAQVAVRFLSVEPLLEDLGTLDLTGIHWVIVGGESGNGARLFNTDWARSIVAQCKAAGVACFVKQFGAHVIQDGERRIKKDKKGGDMDEWPHDLRVRELPQG